MSIRTLRCKNEECNSRNIKTNDPQQLIEYMRKATVEVEGECLDCGCKLNQLLQKSKITFEEIILSSNL